MNKKVLATAMVVLGLFPSLLFAQLYRIEVDAQDSGGQKVIDRVFTGNTVGLQVSFFDGGVPLSMTNWNTRFMYGYGQYDTNGMIPVVGTAGVSNNIVVFESATNVFFSENGNYYFSIVGTNAAGKVRTFARGRMIEEYDPATGGSYSNGIPMPWANLNFASKEWIVDYISTNEFETVVSYGTNSTSAYRGDWGNSVSNNVLSNAASIVAVGAVASNALPASATNGWEVGSHTGLVANVGGGELRDGNWILNGGTFGVWSNAQAEVRLGVFDDEGGGNESAYIGFENGYGYGAIGFRKDGVSGKFVVSEGGPGYYGPWSATNIVLKTLQANIEADIVKIGGVARTNWPSDGSSGISASTATGIAQTVLAAATNAHDGTARASIVEVGAVASNATTAAQAGQIATNVLSTATTNSMPLIDFGSGGGASQAPSKSLGASAVGWPILNTNNAPFVSIVVDTNMGAMLNFPLDTANAVDAMPIVSGTSASITQLVFVARAYAAGGSEWGTVGLKTTFGGSILTNVITLTNAPTTQTVTLAHAPVSGPCVVPFSWGILATSTVGTAVGNARFSVMQARGSW